MLPKRPKETHTGDDKQDNRRRVYPQIHNDKFAKALCLQFLQFKFTVPIQVEPEALNHSLFPTYEVLLAAEVESYLALGYHRDECTTELNTFCVLSSLLPFFASWKEYCKRFMHYFISSTKKGTSSSFGFTKIKGMFIKNWAEWIRINSSTLTSKDILNCTSSSVYWLEILISSSHFIFDIIRICPSMTTVNPFPCWLFNISTSRVSGEKKIIILPVSLLWILCNMAIPWRVSGCAALRLAGSLPWHVAGTLCPLVKTSQKLCCAGLHLEHKESATNIETVCRSYDRAP